MADDLVSYALRAEDALTPALQQAGEAALKLARSQDEQEAAAKRAKEQDDALRAANVQLTETEKALALAIKQAREELALKAQAAGVTTGDMAKAQAAIAASAKAQQVAAATSKQAASAAVEFAEGTAKAAMSARDLEFRGKNLRFQLADIFVTLQQGMNPLIVLSQQGPDVAYALGSVGTAGEVVKKAFGPLGPVLINVGKALPLIAVGAAAVATAWAVYTNQQQAASAATLDQARALDTVKTATEKLKTGLDAARKSWEKFTALGRDVQDQLDIINGLTTEAQVRAKEQAAAAREAAAPAIQAASTRVQLLKQELEARRELERLAMGSDDAAREARQTLGEQTRDVSLIRSELAAAEADLGARQQGLAEFEEKVAMLAEYNDELAKANEGQKEQDAAVKKAAKEADKLNDELERAAAAFEEGFQADYLAGLNQALFEMDAATRRNLETLTDLSERVNGLVPAEALSRVDELRLLLMELQTEAARSEENTAALAESIQRVSGAIAATESQDARQRAAADRAARQQGAVSTAEGIAQATGGLGPALSMAGPYGAAVAAILPIISQTGEEAAQMVENIRRSLFAAFENLPDVIMEFLPLLMGGMARPEIIGEFIARMVDLVPKIAEQFVGTMLPAMIAGVPKLIGSLIGEAVPALVRAVPALIGVLLDPMLWSNAALEIVRAFMVAFTDINVALAGLARDTVKALRQGIRDAFSREFWQEVVASMLEAIRSLFTGIGQTRDASRRRMEGFMARADREPNITINGVIGDERRVAQWFRDLFGRRRTGVAFG